MSQEQQTPQQKIDEEIYRKIMDYKYDSFTGRVCEEEPMYDPDEDYEDE